MCCSFNSHRIFRKLDHFVIISWDFMPQPCPQPPPSLLSLRILPSTLPPSLLLQTLKVHHQLRFLRLKMRRTQPPTLPTIWRPPNRPENAPAPLFLIMMGNYGILRMGSVSLRMICGEMSELPRFFDGRFFCMTKS